MKKIILLLVALLTTAAAATARDVEYENAVKSSKIVPSLSAANQKKADAIYESIRQQYQTHKISADDVVDKALYHAVWSPQLAARCLELVVPSGNKRAMAELGYLYTHYTTAYMFKNKEAEGVKLLSDASKAGNKDATDYLGVYYHLNNQYDNAKTCFENAAPENNAVGTEIKGSMYADGHGYKKNLPKARELYRKAALMGDRNAMAKYAASLKKNRFGGINLPDAFFWMYIAADQGNDASRSNLQLPLSGERYGDDLHTLIARRSLASANQWNKGAKITDDPIYRDGFIKGIKDRQIQADNGDDWSCYYLGSMSYNGDFLKQDYNYVLHYYGKVLQSGKLPAPLLATVCERMADLYRNGKGVQKDAAKAAEFDRMAAQLGSLNAYKRVEKIPE